MRRAFTPVLAIMLVGALSASAQTETYDGRSYARLSYVQGDVHVQRGGDMGAEAGTINLVLVEGDKLGVRNGRAEVSFGGLNALRLDGLTQVEFANLPRGGVEPYKIHLNSGSLILRVGRLASEREFEVHTPDASLYVLSEGLFRVDVEENGSTRLSALEGEAEAAGAEESHRLLAGRSVTALEGRFLSGPAESYAALDDFGRWSRSRDDLLAAGRSASSYLPEELYGYESELGEYGDWRYEADYGYVWVPRVRHYDDWRPYSYGRWVWYPVIGWTWIADEPWGWCVYHYGRWHWRLGLGWYWIPTRHWGPAWVHWHWDGHYVGWCALNRWNRPTVVVNNHFYINSGRHDYSVHNRALVVVERRQLQAPRIAAVALRGDSLRGLGSVSLSTRQPAIAPSVTRSGRLAAEASRTFAQSRGRSVGRTFSGRGASAVDTRRPSLDAGRSVFRSREGLPAAGTRLSESGRTFSSRADSGRIVRAQPSLRSREGVREYALPGRSSGAAGGKLRSGTATPSSPSNDTRGIRTWERSSGRSTVRTREGESSGRTLNPSRQSGRGVFESRSLPSVSRRPSSSEARTSAGFRSPGAYPQSLRSRPGSGGSSSSFNARPRSDRRSVAPATRSNPSYSRPSFNFRAPESRRSSSRTMSSPSSGSGSRVRFSSPRQSGGSSRSFSSSRSSGGASRSFSSSSRSSSSVSRSRSSAGRSSSRSSRSSRRR